MQKLSMNLSKIKTSLSNYSLYIFIIPLCLVLIIAGCLLGAPTGTLGVIETVRHFLTDKLGVFYLLYGIAFVIIAGVMAFSKIGNIRLGSVKEKQYSNFAWGALIFTSTMAADILFYALHEWSLYYSLEPLDTIGSAADQSMVWATSYPLFHWGITPWVFYLVPAVAYAFMFYVKKRRNTQRISEACRPLLKGYTDKAPGKIIDILAVFGLLLGTSTTFSVATPLIAAAFCKIVGLTTTPLIIVLILVVIASVYTIGVIGGFKSINIISKIAVILVSFMLALFFILGGPRFILESGLEGIGYMLNNFIRLSTWTDPLRTTSVPQDFTVFYWAYWIAWAVATPLFIAKISKGRTIKQVILGGLFAGLLGTFTSFIVLGGAGLNLQTSGAVDAIGMLGAGASSSEVIVEIISALPASKLLLALLVVSMILLYATTFDTIAHTMASYITKNLDINGEPSKGSKLIWSLMFVILPIALIFSESTTQGLMAMSIIGAFPLSIIFIMVVISFFKEVKSYLKFNNMLDSLVSTSMSNAITSMIKDKVNEVEEEKPSQPKDED